MAAPTPLERISSHAFEHEADRKALEALKRTAGFDRLMRAIARLGADQVWRVVNESSNIRLSERQVPDVYAVYARVARTLDIDPLPPLYLEHDVRLNAYTAGVDEPFVVVTSGLVEGFDDDELAFVLGHELGHMLAGHVLYGMVARSLGAMLGILSDLTPLGGLIKLSLFTALQYWSRCAELTADRAGLLAVQDPQIALRATMKLGSGVGPKISRGLDLDAFMDQVRAFEDQDPDRSEKFWRTALEADRSHPWPVVRAHELDAWVRAGHLQHILQGHYPRRASSLIAGLPSQPLRDLSQPDDAAADHAERTIRLALSRVFGIHTAPHIPEPPLQMALRTYASNLDPQERVVALYDNTFSGHGDRGLLLTDRQLFTSDVPHQGIPYRGISSIKPLEGSLLRPCGLALDGVELRVHKRAVRDALLSALRPLIPDPEQPH